MKKRKPPTMRHLAEDQNPSAAIIPERVTVSRNLALKPAASL